MTTRADEDHIAHTWLAAVTLLATSLAAPVSAQEAPRVGELVEARIVGHTEMLRDRHCVAPLSASLGDTLMLPRTANCPIGSNVARIRVVRGDHGSRLEHAGAGFLMGAVVGGVLSWMAAGGDCGAGDCGDNNLAAGIVTLFGSAAGGLVGGVVGASLPAGPRWIEMGGERPILVGALDLHPALRVSLDERRR